MPWPLESGTCLLRKPSIPSSLAGKTPVPPSARTTRCSSPNSATSSKSPAPIQLRPILHAKNLYVFDRAITRVKQPDDTSTTNYISPYKARHFVNKTKQGASDCSVGLRNGLRVRPLSTLP